MNTAPAMDEVDWNAAGEKGLMALAQARVNEKQAAHAYEVRSQTWAAWSLAGLVFSLPFVFCSDKALAESIALYGLCFCTVVTGALSFQARQRRNRRREEVQEVIDALAQEFPKPATASEDEPPQEA